MCNRAERHAPQPRGHAPQPRGHRAKNGDAGKQNFFFMMHALERCAGRKNAGGAAAGGEFQKSESVSFMSAVDGGDRHARHGVGRAESLAIFFAADFLLLLIFCCC